MSERQSPDAVLVRQILAGDTEAYSSLVRKYQDYAYGVAMGLMSDFDLARDVVQETFLCAYRDLAKLRDPSRFAGWLRGIVRHTALRALRELERLRSMAEEFARSARVRPPAPSPVQAAEAVEQREAVERALGGLSESNREAVSLYYVNGLSYEEIAGFLGVSEGTVHGRLQRAREKLRRELKMVAETFKAEELPKDFSEEIRRLLEGAAARGEEHERAIRRLAEIGAPAVDPLCEALDDVRVPVRRAAARALCAIGDARALKPILRVLLADQAWQIDVFESGRVLTIPGMRKALLDVLREGTARDRWAVLSALSHAKDDDEVFERALRIFREPGPDRALARAALEVLCDIRPGSGPDLIVEALEGSDLGLRGSAAWAAVRREITPPAEACLKAFVEGVHWWGRVCAGNLVLKHGAEGRQALERVMRERSHAESCTAAMALAREGSEEAFEVLKRELLGSPRDRGWAKAVSRALARRYGQRLAAWIDSAGGRLTSDGVVAWTLARSAPVEAGPAVEGLLRDGTPAVRCAALRILARRQGAELLPELRRILGEGRPRKVAQEAFRQMLRLGEEAEPTARQMLESSSWTERKAAAALLRRWGKLTAEQRARAEKDTHVAVRHAVGPHPSSVAASGWHPKWGRRIPGNR